jgi:hypothetical protein
VPDDRLNRRDRHHRRSRRRPPQRRQQRANQQHAGAQVHIHHAAPGLLVQVVDRRRHRHPGGVHQPADAWQRRQCLLGGAPDGRLVGDVDLDGVARHPERGAAPRRLARARAVQVPGGHRPAERGQRHAGGTADPAGRPGHHHPEAGEPSPPAAVASAAVTGPPPAGTASWLLLASGPRSSTSASSAAPATGGTCRSTAVLSDAKSETATRPGARPERASRRVFRSPRLRSLPPQQAMDEQRELPASATSPPG